MTCGVREMACKFTREEKALIAAESGCKGLTNFPRATVLDRARFHR
jgi:hypothetical protein